MQHQQSETPDKADSLADFIMRPLPLGRRVALAVISGILGTALGTAFWRMASKQSAEGFSTLPVSQRLMMYLAIVSGAAGGIYMFLKAFRRVTRFLTRPYTWIVTGLITTFVVVSWLIACWVAGDPFGPVLPFALVIGLVYGIMVATGFPVRLTRRRLLIILGLAVLLVMGLLLISIWLYSTLQGGLGRDELVTEATNPEFIAAFIMIFPFVCWFVWMVWSGMAVAWRFLRSVPTWLLGAVEWLVLLYKRLVLFHKVSPRLVLAAGMTIAYVFLVSSVDGILGIAHSLLDALQVNKLGTPQEWREGVAFFVSFVGLANLSLLMSATMEYIMIPQSLASVRLIEDEEEPNTGDNYTNIQGIEATARLILMLIALFSVWWVFYSSFAENLNMADPGAFAFVGGTQGTPEWDDFWFFTFATMTNASYIEIRPVSDYARLTVVAMTATGLALLVIFVGVGLALMGQEVTPAASAVEGELAAAEPDGPAKGEDLAPDVDHSDEIA